MKHVYRLLTIYAVLFNSAVSAAPLYRPYFDGSSTIEMHRSTYCQDADSERFLWMTINKYSKSILAVFPRVPPDQQAYLDAEWTSGDTDRAMQAFMNPYTRIKEVIVTGQMLENLTDKAVEGYEFLTFQNKVLIAAVSLKSIRNEELNSNNLDNVVDALRRKGFNVDRKNLGSFVSTNYFLENTLIDYLQCLGSLAKQ